MTARILLVDDEPAVRRSVRANLVARGFDVIAVEQGGQALDEFARHHPDLVILDLMLPGISGIEVAEALRLISSVPILILSARGEEATKVRALDLGADDYLTKPFGMDELLARVRALLRRVPAESSVPQEVFTVGGLTLDVRSRVVHQGGVPVELTAREFDILAYLMQRSGRIVTHRALLHDVWGPEYVNETQYLRVFVNRLRRKIENDPTHPHYILTEPGVGYRFIAPA